MGLRGASTTGRPEGFKESVGIGDFFSWINPVRAIRDEYRWSKFEEALLKAREEGTELRYRERPLVEESPIIQNSPISDDEGAATEKQSAGGSSESGKYVGNSAYAKVSRLRRGVNECNERIKKLRELKREVESLRAEVYEHEVKMTKSVNKMLQIAGFAMAQYVNVEDIFPDSWVTPGGARKLCIGLAGKNLESDGRFADLREELWGCSDGCLDKMEGIRGKLVDYLPKKLLDGDLDSERLEKLEKELERQKLFTQLAEAQMRGELLRVYRFWRNTGKIERARDIYCPEMLEKSNWVSEAFAELESKTVKEDKSGEFRDKDGVTLTMEIEESERYADAMGRNKTRGKAKEKFYGMRRKKEDGGQDSGELGPGPLDFLKRLNEIVMKNHPPERGSLPKHSFGGNSQSVEKEPTRSVVYKKKKPIRQRPAVYKKETPIRPVIHKEKVADVPQVKYQKKQVKWVPFRNLEGPNDSKSSQKCFPSDHGIFEQIPTTMIIIR